MKKEANRNLASSRARLANHEIVVLAAYLVGAGASAVDIEDIAIQANALAPGRFTWRKFNEQINIDTVRKRLWDATKPAKGAYLMGSEKSGWRLTKKGYDFARKQISLGTITQPESSRMSQDERGAATREIRRMMSEEAYRKMCLGQSQSITKSEVERFFRLDDYVVGKARAARIERVRIIANDNHELTRAIEVLVKLLQDV